VPRLRPDLPPEGRDPLLREGGTQPLQDPLQDGPGEDQVGVDPGQGLRGLDASRGNVHGAPAALDEDPGAGLVDGGDGAAEEEGARRPRRRRQGQEPPPAAEEGQQPLQVQDVLFRPGLGRLHNSLLATSIR
jgi:hypothetical protein